jgi:carbon starvation protein
MGFLQRYLQPPLWLLTIVFVPATLFVVWMGTKVSTYFILDAKWWALLILAYCCVASMVPVWSLLQPRGYLGGFVLYFALALGVIGIFFGGYEIQQDAFKGFNTGTATGLLFPFLFVTIACGACSGFHGLVCSGTTSKQIDRETHIRPVGYGGMLAEAFVALIAMVTVMIVAQKDLTGLKPGTIYGNGVGNFLTLIIGEKYRNFAITFGAMAFSTFVFDTLDVSTRLGRYILQELTGWTGKAGAVFGTAVTVIVPLAVLLGAGEGAYRSFWVLFGTSNQLLAALSLLGLSVWLRRLGKPNLFTFLPMSFVMLVTLWSLVLQVKAAALTVAASGLRYDAVVLNGGVSVLLIVLALILVSEASRGWSRGAPAVKMVG